MKDVYLSTNTGTSWTAGDTDLTHHTVAAIAVSNNLFAGTSLGYAWPGRGVFLSTNNGTSWINHFRQSK